MSLQIKQNTYLLQNELTKPLISTKELTKDLINGCKILNGTKYYSSGLFQNCLVFIPAKKYIRYFNFNILLLEYICGNLAFLLQLLLVLYITSCKF